LNDMFQFQILLQPLLAYNHDLKKFTI
jgi:hypothetical protein